MQNEDVTLRILLTFGEVSRRLTTKSPFVSVAIKVRAEQTCLFCRTAATKRSEAHLKEGFRGIVYITGNSRLFKSKTARARQWCINRKQANHNQIVPKSRWSL